MRPPFVLHETVAMFPLVNKIIKMMGLVFELTFLV